MILHFTYKALYAAGRFVFSRATGRTRARHFLFLMQTKNTQEKEQQNNKFTTSWLKSFKGLEDLTEKKAQELINAMRRFSCICFDFYQQVNAADQFTQLSTSKAQR